MEFLAFQVADINDEITFLSFYVQKMHVMVEEIQVAKINFS